MKWKPPALLQSFHIQCSCLELYMSGTFSIWSPVTLWTPTEHAKRRLKVTEGLVMASDPEQLFFATEEPCDLSHWRFKFKCLICFLTLSLRPHLMMHPHLSTTWPPLPAHTHTHILSQQALRRKPRPSSPVTSSSSNHILWKQWGRRFSISQIANTNASTKSHFSEI